MLVSQPKMSALSVSAGAVLLGDGVKLGVVSDEVGVSEIAVAEAKVGVRLVMARVSVMEAAGEGERMMGVGVRMDGVRDGNGLGGL